MVLQVIFQVLGLHTLWAATLFSYVNFEKNTAAVSASLKGHKIPHECNKCVLQLNNVLILRK